MMITGGEGDDGVEVRWGGEGSEYIPTRYGGYIPTFLCDRIYFYPLGVNITQHFGVIFPSTIGWTISFPLYDGIYPTPFGVEYITAPL